MSQPSAEQTPFDASIPVLTEVVAEPAIAPAPAPAARQDPPEPLERRAAQRWTGEEWSVLERRVTERVLQGLQGRIDFVLEQRLREAVQEAVNGALAGLAGEMQTSLQQAVGQIVTQAVAQEITHLRTLGK